MARKVKAKVSIERYLKGLQDKKRRMRKRKGSNTFDPVRYEPQKERAVMGPYETRKVNDIDNI